MLVRRHPERFTPRLERVLVRPRAFEPERARTLIQRVLERSEAEARQAAEGLLVDFGSRHRALGKALLNHYELAAPHAPAGAELSSWHKLLIGAYFSMEYAIEAAAFFNPSLVPAPNQNDLPEGALRVCFSFRAVGEGHISSVVFREAVLHASGRLEHVPVGRWVDSPASIDFPRHPLSGLEARLSSLPAELSATLLERLPDPFSYAQLKQAVDEQRQHTSSAEDLHRLQRLLESTEDVYALRFAPETVLGERVIFPVLEHERNGIEDARFTQFTHADGRRVYYGTYTAYDGQRIQPRLLETEDFLSFRSHGLSGKGAINKNLALFPRTLAGRYAMLARIDGVNNYLMFSDKLTHWDDPVLIDEPQELWELGNSGNCGSPLETEAGWLVITHGVGPLRRYVLGAMLLDLEDPTRVIGRLREPMLMPAEDEREGYVPNVVYSCGSLIHQGRVIIPYGISDRAGGIISVALDELLDNLKP